MQQNTPSHEPILSTDDAGDPAPWFLETIEMVFEVARQESGADRFEFSQFDQSVRQFTPRASHNLPGKADAGVEVVTYPLQGRHGLAGTVDFVFSKAAKPAEGYRDVLQHAVNAAETLLQAAGTSSLLLHLTARISELEGKLAGLKIRERARGLLQRETSYSRSEAIRSHVAGVLQLSELEQVLSQRLLDAEQRLAERQAVSRAKAVMEQAFGLTEEQAYARLRDASRRTRTKLSQVAADVIAGGTLAHAGR